MTATMASAYERMNIEYSALVEIFVLSFSESTGKGDGLC